jgi:hypothetical protein
MGITAVTGEAATWKSRPRRPDGTVGDVCFCAGVRHHTAGLILVGLNSRESLVAAGRALCWLAPERSPLCRSPGQMFVPMPCRGLDTAARRAGGRQCRGQGRTAAAVAPRPTGGLLPRVAPPRRAGPCLPRNQNRRRGLPRAGQY